jgi:VWFA-related protein
VQGQSSTQSVPTIRTSTEVVLVPIVATRSDGSKVKDLRPSELRLFDNGKSQTVLSFERMGVTSATSNVTSGPSQLAISPVADQYPHFSIILLDALNTAWSDQVYARRAVEHLLDYSPPGERTALFALSNRLYLLHDFTSNAEELRAALRNLSVPPPNRGTVSSSDSPYSAAVSYSNLAAFSNLTHSREIAAGFESRFYLRRRILQTFDALSAIAQVAKPIPGQKDLLWVSSAFPLLVRGRDDALDNDSYYDQEQQTARELSSAGLRVYPIDARGLSSNPNAIINISTMQRFAADTGGRAFFNNNDLSSLMRQALEDSRAGYLLTYTPKNFRVDGSFHTIRIRVSRPGVHLRYRPGYYAEALTSQADTKPE